MIRKQTKIRKIRENGATTAFVVAHIARKPFLKTIH